MLEGFNEKEALDFVLDQLNNDKAYEGVPKDELESITAQVMEADKKYMEIAQNKEDGVYDEDDAYDFILETLSEGMDQESKALVSLITDGYLEYFDQYLEDNDLIDWE